MVLLHRCQGKQNDINPPLIYGNEDEVDFKKILTGGLKYILLEGAGVISNHLFKWTLSWMFFKLRYY